MRVVAAVGSGVFEQDPQCRYGAAEIKQSLSTQVT